jgi:hypothetical protein
MQKPKLIVINTNPIKEATAIKVGFRNIAIKT